MRERLKQERKRLGMTQKQVAEYLHISERNYKYIESGHVVGSVDLWDNLEDLFRVNQRILRATQ